MKKILIASSSKQFLKRNSDLLSGRGLELLSTTSGAQVIKLHDEYPFDLLFSDVRLEDMDGRNLCSLVNKERELRHIPIILCCLDYVGEFDHFKRDKKRAIYLLVKPIDPVQLLEMISTVLHEQIGRSKRVEFKVKVLSKKLGLEFICHSYDISNTGILVETENQLNLGDQIVCQFTLPGSCEIKTEGEVIRSVSSEGGKIFYGIKFINISLAQFKAIDEYVDLKAESLARIKVRNHHEKLHE